jgi:hypothetical protein
MFKYFVVVDDPDQKDQVHNELGSNFGSSTVPMRPVACDDNMPGSLHNGLFWLTPEEAEILNSDPRVRDVHRIPEEDDISLGLHGSRSGIFDRSFASVTTSMKNWALSRSINTVDNFYGAASTSTPYTYNLDGTGVDIIIMDSGVEANHPEFAVNADGTGGSRVVNHDWTQYGIITSVPTGGFMGDSDGHGSNCASIAAGNTCGWASNAAIYSMRIYGGLDITTGATLGALDEYQCWQTIRAFHLAKPTTSTGYKRPTIVNCSFGYYANYNNIVSVNHRGSVATLTTTTGNGSSLYGMVGAAAGDGTCPARNPAEEADLTAAIAVGVIVVGSAGNNAHKIDISGGLDYNNYWTSGTGSVRYYHRGSSPASAPGVICVGAISYSVPEHKASYSSTGPRVNVFAPGSAIMGAHSSVSFTAAVQDPRNTTYYLDKLQGTSQAGPQVAGMAALLVQARPWMTTTNVLNFIQSSSLKGQLDETYYGVVGTYTNFASMQGTGNYYAYFPFNNQNVMTINSSTTSLASASIP